MKGKCLFESKGWIKKRQIGLIFGGAFFLIMGLYLFIPLMQRAISNNPWTRYDRPEIIEWIIPILLITFGAYSISVSFISRKAYLKIYEDHIEANCINLFRIAFGGNGSTASNIMLTFDEIKGVSSQKGTVVIETYGKTRTILCSDCLTAEKIIWSKLRMNKQNK